MEYLALISLLCTLALLMMYVCECYLTLCVSWLVNDRASWSEVRAIWEPYLLTSASFLPRGNTAVLDVNTHPHKTRRNVCWKEIKLFKNPCESQHITIFLSYKHQALYHMYCIYCIIICITYTTSCNPSFPSVMMCSGVYFSLFCYLARSLDQMRSLRGFHWMSWNHCDTSGGLGLDLSKQENS